MTIIKRFLKDIPVQNLKKSNKIFIQKCFEQNQIHILISTFQLGLFLVDVEWVFDNGEIHISNTTQKSLGNSYRINIVEFLEDRNKTEKSK